KPRRQMARRIFHRLRILDLTRRKNAVQKALPKPLKRMLDPRVLDQVHADAEHAHRSQTKHCRASASLAECDDGNRCGCPTINSSFVIRISSLASALVILH